MTKQVMALICVNTTLSLPLVKSRVRALYGSGRGFAACRCYAGAFYRCLSRWFFRKLGLCRQSWVKPCE